MQKITMIKRNEVTVQELLRLFLKKCEVKNLTDESISSYKRKCKRFIDYIGEEQKASEIKPEDIDNFILYLKDNPKVNDISIL